MKAHVIGVSRINGTSNKSGKLKDYDMGKLLVLQPIEPKAKEDKEAGTCFAVSGYGYETMEVDLDPVALIQFKDVRFPCVLDLEMDQRPMFGKLATVCTGINQPAKLAA